MPSGPVTQGADPLYSVAAGGPLFHDDMGVDVPINNTNACLEVHFDMDPGVALPGPWWTIYWPCWYLWLFVATGYGVGLGPLWTILSGLYRKKKEGHPFFFHSIPR